MHRNDSVMDALQVEELDDAPLQQQRRQRPKRPVVVGISARLITLTGMATILFGLTIALSRVLPLPVSLPDFHPGGLLVVTAGLVLWTLGSLRRGQSLLAQRDEDLILLEQVAADMSQLQEGFTRLRQESAGNRAETRAMVSQIQALAEQEEQAREQGQDGGRDGDALQDGLFRLAASLDQLGARIEKRMHVHNSTLQDRLEEFSQTMVDAHGGLRDMLSDMQGYGQYATQYAQPQVEEAPAHQETAEHDPWSGTEEHVPEAPASPEVSLGLLDQLDASGRRDSRRSPEVPPQPAIEAGSLPSALPSRRPQRGTWEEELEMVASKSPQDSDLDVDTKLHQLSQLLTDERLRNALDQMRRASGG